MLFPVSPLSKMNPEALCTLHTQEDPQGKRRRGTLRAPGDLTRSQEGAPQVSFGLKLTGLGTEEASTRPVPRARCEAGTSTVAELQLGAQPPTRCSPGKARPGPDLHLWGVTKAAPPQQRPCVDLHLLPTGVVRVEVSGESGEETGHLHPLCCPGGHPGSSNNGPPTLPRHGGTVRACWGAGTPPSPRL